MLIKHVRDDDDCPVATIVADLVDGTVQIGISVCHKTLDVFNKQRGVEIAAGRVKTNKSSIVPNRRIVFHGRKRRLFGVLVDEVDSMRDRCDRYYKQLTIA